MMQQHVHVVGGGWAGLTAATKLNKNGIKVTLIEQSDHVGGRCTSFWDENFGEWLDIGTHAFLGAYEQVFELLNTWGVDYNQHLKFVSDVEWLSPNGDRLKFSISSSDESPKGSKRKALQSLATLMTFKGMRFRDRLKTAKVLESLINFRPEKYRIEPTIAEYLWKFGIGRSDCGGLWVALCVSVFNGQPETIGLFPLVNAIKEGLMLGGKAARLGVMTTSFKQLLIDPAEKYLHESGVEVLNRSRVQQLSIDDNNNIIGAQFERKKLHCEHVILAIPPNALLRIHPTDTASGDYFHRFTEFEMAPIATVHINMKTSHMNSDVVMIPKSFTQWLFTRGAENGNGRTNISAIVSDAPPKKKMKLEEIEEAVLMDLDRWFGRTSKPVIYKIKTLRFPDATILLKPGSKNLRPSAKTPIKGLYLAGDWCDTGLPATIESATRSGNMAAEELLKSL